MTHLLVLVLAADGVRFDLDVAPDLDALGHRRRVRVVAEARLALVALDLDAHVHLGRLLGATLVPRAHPDLRNNNPVRIAKRVLVPAACRMCE